MSSILVAIVAGSVICIVMVGVFMLQARERARMEKLAQVNRLSHRYRRLQQLLHDLPSQYLNKELRTLLLRQSLSALKALLAMDSSATYRSQYEKDVEYLQQVEGDLLSFNPDPVDSPQKCREARNLLSVLFKFVKQQAKVRNIEAGSAQVQLEHLLFLQTKCRAEMFEFEAEAAALTNNPHQAINAYHNAIACFNSITANPNVPPILDEFRKKIAEQTQIAEAANIEVKEKALEAQKSEQWDQFMGDDEDTWKKKTAYD